MNAPPERAAPALPPALPPLGLCIAGPTASGKSALALAAAEALAHGLAGTELGAGGAEIISVDSALVYRGMDIGTAKPSAAERGAVPHHLIDILEPTERYSAARFAAEARALASAIRARGRVPLLVGGTMLYFKALREGIDELPAADAGLRAQIDAEAAALGWPALHAELARHDPATAARLAPHDAQRIQRALEVLRGSGRPLSSWTTGAGTRAAGGGEAARWPLLSLEPASRAWLHERIAARFAQMLADGLLAELAALRARGDLHPGLPSMRCVGYRQAWEALEDAGGKPDEVDAKALFERGVAATRQLAKRQLTWLRSTPARTPLAADAPDALQQGMRLLQAWAAAGRGGGART